LFENFRENSLKRDLSNGTTANPPLFSLVNTFKAPLIIHKNRKKIIILNIVADPNPGSGIRCLFDPWIRNRFFPDPGSQNHISIELNDKFFWEKNNSLILCETAQIFFFTNSKII
jgi:hypothetical protein